MSIMHKVAEHAPWYYEYLVKTAGAVKRSPFSDEILEDMDVLIKACGHI